MSESIVVAIVAASAAMLPGIIAGILSLIGKRVDHRFELEKTRVELINQKRLDAIFHYFACLSKMSSEKLPEDDLKAFLEAHQRLCLFVSPETLSMMEIVLRKFEIVHADDHLRHPAFDANGFAANLLRQFNAELNYSHPSQHKQCKKKARN